MSIYPAPSQQQNIDYIRQALGYVWKPGEVYEIRIPIHKFMIHAGYFDDFDIAARLAWAYSGSVPAIYGLLNPCNPRLLNRYRNRIQEKAPHTTLDEQI